MVGLKDIAPEVEQVTIRGESVDVYGVSAGGIATLLGRFPDLRKMMSGVEVDANTLFSLGGEIVAAVIAAGTGSPGDREAEEVASRLSAGEQAALLGAIIRVTMPNGIGPFVRDLEALAETLGGVASGQSVTAQVMKSRKRSKP